MDKLKVFDENVKIAVEKFFPDLKGIHRFHVKAAISKTDGNVADLQLLDVNGKADEGHPILPSVRLPSELSTTPAGAVVRIGFYYADPDQPFIESLA